MYQPLYWFIFAYAFFFLNQVFFFFITSCGILLPWPGMESVPPTMDAENLNHWTAREIPVYAFWDYIFFKVGHLHPAKNVEETEEHRVRNTKSNSPFLSCSLIFPPESSRFTSLFRLPSKLLCWAFKICDFILSSPQPYVAAIIIMFINRWGNWSTERTCPTSQEK